VPADPDLVKEPTRRVIGVDVFVESGLGPEELGPSLERLAAETSFRLKGISNRGTVVYPPTGAMTDCIDQWFCRFLAGNGEPSDADVLDLVRRIGAEHRWMHLEKLQEFHGEEAFTKAQGED
jgi:isocitrate dehydrogenase